MPWAVAPRSSGTAWLRKYIAARCAAPKLMACGHYSRNDRSVPQARKMRTERRPPDQSVAKLIAGVNRMRAKSGAARGIAIASSLSPMEPHQHVGQIAAKDDKQGVIDEGQAPGERVGLKSAKPAMFWLTDPFEGPRY